MSVQKYRSEKGKTITIHDDGHIFVNGDCTGLKQWTSCSTRYSNLSGSEQKDLKGLDVESALLKRGKLWFRSKKRPTLQNVGLFLYKKYEILFFH